MKMLTYYKIEKQVVQDFKETFAPEHGQRALERIAKFCKEDDECYKKDRDDTLFNLGNRSVILMIRRQLKRDFKEDKQKKVENR